MGDTSREPYIKRHRARRVPRNRIIAVLVVVLILTLVFIVRQWDDPVPAPLPTPTPTVTVTPTYVPLSGIPVVSLIPNDRRTFYIYPDAQFMELLK